MEITLVPRILWLLLATTICLPVSAKEVVALTMTTTAWSGGGTLGLACSCIGGCTLALLVSGKGRH